MAKTTMRTALYWLACFLTPIVMLCVTAAWSGVYPFGAESFLNADLKYQYIDFFTWYRSVLTGDANPFYSFAQGLGANTWGLISYYLASPFNLLILLFDTKHLTLFVFVITALRLGCIACATVFFLCKRFGLSRAWSFILAICFAWSAWSATNVRNVMWMDNLIILPFAWLAIHTLVRFGRWRALITVIAVSVLACWYTAYMTICFLVLIFVFEWFALPRRTAGAPTDQPTPAASFPRLTLRFFAGILLGLGLSSWLFLPTVLAMRSSGGAISPRVQEYIDWATALASGILARMPLVAWVAVGLLALILVVLVMIAIITGLRGNHHQRTVRILWVSAALISIVCALAFAKVPTLAHIGTLITRCDFGQLLRSFLLGGWQAERTPQFFAGTITVVLAIAMLVIRTIPSRTRQCAIALLMLMVAATWLVPLHIVWCGMRYPKGFYARTGVYVTFFLIAMAAMAARELSLKWQATRLRSRILNIGDGMVGVAAVCKNAANAIIAILTVCELIFGATLCWKQLYVGYTQERHDSYMAAARNQAEQLKALDGGVYRFDRTTTRAESSALNESMSTGLMSLSGYSSANNAAALDLLADLGYGQKGEMVARYAYPNLLTDSLLGVKYVSGTTGMQGWEQVIPATDDTIAPVYHNPYALPLGYAVDASAAGSELPAGDNAFTRQNAFVSTLLGTNVSPWHMIDATPTGSKDGLRSWSLTLPGHALGYTYVVTSDTQPFTLTVDGSESSLENERTQHAVHPVGEGGTHTVTLAATQGDQLLAGDATVCVFAYLDLDELADIVDRLAEHPFVPSVFSDGHVEGTVSVTEGQVLLITTPYDTGWSITVNGHAIDAQPVSGGALTAIPVQAGSNTIVMRFTPQGLVPGIALSLFCCAGITVVMVRRRHRTIVPTAAAQH